MSIAESPPSSGSGSALPAERLLVQCLECAPDRREAILDRLCRDYPSEALQLRELHGRLATVGLLGGVATDQADFPERLGDFRLLRRLGRGGMGVVYLAEQESFGRQVALKLMQPGSLYFPGAHERFRREARAIALLKHPNIVPVHAFGDEDGIPYLAMEWVEGITLAQVVESVRGRRPAGLAGRDLAGALSSDAGTPLFDGTWTQACLRMTAVIADALAHAHENGVIHRDIKPSNVMLTPEGRIVLLDFGLAHTRGVERLTRDGSQPGSLPYMPPEQVRGDSDKVDERSDVYSLGATLYELLTLQLPYHAENVEKTRQRILDGSHLPVGAHNAAVPHDAETVCHKAMELRRARRYRSATAFREDLDRVLRFEPIVAVPPGPLSRLWKWAQRHPGVASMSVLLLLTLLIALAWTLRQNRALDTARDDAVAKAELHARQAGRLLRLADLTRYDRLVFRHADLDAVLPLNADAYRDWVVDAEVLIARLPLHENTLRAMHANLFGSAVPGDLGAPHENHRDPNSFEQQFEHDLLTNLVQKLRAWQDPDTGLLPLMKWRTEYAEHAEEWTIDDHRAAWHRARLELRADPRFAGVDLRPQVGLVPLGRDPRSGLQEFLHLLTHEGPIPKRRRSGALTIGRHTGIVLVLLPGATFWMGVQNTDPSGRNYDPDPVVAYGIDEVSLDPFFVAKDEMTQGQWWCACRERPSYYPGRDRKPQDLFPVESISWHTAEGVLRKMDLQLPTEAQWEYACRAGAETMWSTGSVPESLRGYANIRGPESRFSPSLVGAVADDGYSVVAPVGTFLPNAFGLHDMHGNVVEWCRDGRLPYDEFDARSGDGYRGTPTVRNRVVRGGNYKSAPRHAAAGHRVTHMLETLRGSIGARPARRLGQ